MFGTTHHLNTNGSKFKNYTILNRGELADWYHNHKFYIDFDI